MGAVPKRKLSTRRQGKRRANKKISLKNLLVCSNCGQKKESHRICPSCRKK
ncbi:50S ribosomal protein L32 [Patescibacteria group bacterium]|nr:50S ribosomal protein L32 [Patescibacteria group bacterium]MBU1931728.1 50S ribosomal protein L32 [Patescibacteria group bacterium]